MAAGPYPAAASIAVSAVMRANRGEDTKPEVKLRTLLHREGVRFRKHQRLVAKSIRVRPDIVFGRARVAVFVDGCFWHSCQDHGTQPKNNASYWGPKLRRNVERDREVNEALEADGWTVLRIWEHTPTEEAVALVLEHIRRTK